MKVTTDACLFGAWVASIADKNASYALDIGAGTGLLSLMLAQQCKAETDAIEIHEDTAGQARDNFDSSPWKDRLSCFDGDAKYMAFALARHYDIIISNPPFYENELQSGNQQKNLAHHSTQLQLEDLLIILRDSLDAAGRFYLLLPYKRQEEIEKLFAKSDLTIIHKVLMRQSTKHGFFRIMLEGKKGKSNEEAVVEEIAIKDNHDQYTAEFASLLKDYYLYL
jgi:tRNA1Val (adenine37-N6)-methyltransferase